MPDVEQSLLDPFPPALIPIWSTGARTVVGLWKHWFSCRQPTFVEFYGTTVYGRRDMAIERGRSLKQLVYGHLFECIVNNDGVDEEIEEFATSCGIQDLDEVERRCLEGGLVKSLQSHPEFAHDPPLSFFESDNQSDYSGDFPTNAITSDTGALRDCCVYELHAGFRNLKPDHGLREAVSQNAASPEWLRTRSQHALFGRSLDAGDLQAAWMCLNSPEWRMSSARQAIMDLAERAGDPSFSALATTWATLPFADDETF